MKIDTNDPVNKLLKSGYVTQREYKYLPSWKLDCIRKERDLTFIILDDSQYLLAVTNLSKSSKLIGIWDTRNDSGVSVSEVTVDLLPHSCQVISMQKLSPLSPKLSKDPKSVDSRAYDLLSKMITSPLHQHMSAKELAVRSIQVAIEFNKAFSELESAVANTGYEDVL